MVKVTVGGRQIALTMPEVVHKMRGIEPEPIREHLVELPGGPYPPKQVLAAITGWDRQSFTTMEAQRVLTRVGFVCRRAGQRPDGQSAWELQDDGDEAVPVEDRVAALESALVVAQEAIASLTSRVRALEAARAEAQ